LRELFLLDPEVTFLNHGSFGACPRVVFERYQHWQRELEREPVEFIARRLPDLLAEARAALAAYVGAAAEDVTFVQNATTGVNMAARALGLAPEDEVLSTTLEYGTCVLTWQRMCRFVQVDVDELFDHVTERTRAVYVSHITSSTGLLLPVEEIVAEARGRGLTTIVDGAHAPAHVDLDLEALGADFYAATCHNWRARVPRATSPRPRSFAQFATCSGTASALSTTSSRGAPQHSLGATQTSSSMSSAGQSLRGRSRSCASSTSGSSRSSRPCSPRSCGSSGPRLGS